MTEKRGRIPWIDVAKGIAMFLVLFGHLPGSGDNPWFPDLMASREVVYLFHMPLFFVLSGLTFHPSGGFKDFAVKRLRRLIIPYYFFSLYALAKLALKVAAPSIFSSFHAKDMGAAPAELLNIILGNSFGLWFFWALFWGDLVLWFLGRCSTLCRNSVCLLALLVWPAMGLLPFTLPFQLPATVEAVAFTGIGWILSDWLESLSRQQSLAATAVTAVVFAFSAYMLTSTTSPKPVEYTLKIVAAVSGSALIIFLIQTVVPANRPIEYVGRNTLIFYGLNGFSLALAKGVIFKLIPLQLVRSSVWSQLACGLLAIAVACFICTVLTPLIHRYCWWAIGEQRPKQPTPATL